MTKFKQYKHKETPQDKLRAWKDSIAEMLALGEIDRKTYEYHKREVDKIVSCISSKNSDKEYITFDLSKYAYSTLLSKDIDSVEEVFRMLSDVFGLEPDVIEQLRYNNYVHGAKVVMYFDKKSNCQSEQEIHAYSKQKRISQNGVLDRKSLKGAKTINSQLHTLHNNKKASDKMDSLTDRLESVEDELDSVKATTTIQDENLSQVNEILGIPKPSRDKIMITLRDKGFTYDKIAKVVGVSKSTVIRFFRKYDSENDTKMTPKKE